DNRTFFLIGPDCFQFFEAASGKAIREFEGHQSSIEAVAFSPDGKHVATGSQEDGVRIWDIHSRKPVLDSERSGAARGVFCLTFGPKGDDLAGAVGSDIVVWNTGDGRELSHVRAYVAGGV